MRFRFRALLALFTATHEMRVAVLREAAKVNMLEGPAHLRPMWRELYEATRDGTITPTERRAVRARLVTALNSNGRTFWADLLGGAL